MERSSIAFGVTAEERVALESLARELPTEAAVVAEIAALGAGQTLPAGTVHVLSDIHGEAAKLKHVIHNASGSLRPLVEDILGDTLDPQGLRELLTFIYYPSESWKLRVEGQEGAEARSTFHRIISLEFKVMRAVARRAPARRVEGVFPPKYRELFVELFFARSTGLGADHSRTLLDLVHHHGLALDFLRHVSRAIRNLSITEIICAGDCGDRGPRIDRVIDTFIRQPNVAITWGNHDVTWMAACLGHELSIATVLRISLRYRRLSQLEEGYGIIVSPLEKLARTVYADDPAERFKSKGEGLRDPLVLARMQKAVAIIETKLTGQAIGRNPHWDMADRDLLSRVNLERGTLNILGTDHPLLDRVLPTVDPARPLALSDDEQACMDRIRASFLHSNELWRQMLFLKRRGSMSLVRKGILIFHGCLPVDEEGEFLPMIVDGEPYSGRSLFRKLESVVHRTFRERRLEDLDLLWYLWSGARSPLFGKDKMATFERYLLADEATHTETKNAYFRLIHDVAFCDRILREFGVNPERGIIINGHVPVKIEKGEDPVKKSGKAITIDGAFSRAYGDHGYTLILDAEGITLARHHHFDSVEEAVKEGTEIIPEVRTIRRYERALTQAETEEGRMAEDRIGLLEKLLLAYRENLIAPSGLDA